MDSCWTVDTFSPLLSASPSESMAVRRESDSEPYNQALIGFERDDRDDLRVRRFESAKTDRLNQAHWEYASDQHINVDLISDLPTLWARCVYEASNNPLIEGVIETYITDLVGENGPVCQIEPRLDQEDSAEWDAYTTEAEALIAELSETGWDLHGELPLADLLALWVWSEWTIGDILGQEVSVNQRNSPSIRINPIDPRRLQSPFVRGSDDICVGVERDRSGKRLRYWFTEPRDRWMYGSNADVRSIDSRFIYHEYRRREIGQVRGVPILGGCLQVLADLRDFDTQTLDAARSAADFAAVAYTTMPEAGFVATNESTPIKRRRITHLPPGWQLTQLAPQHPSTQYVQFRRERLREVGRAVAMPLMTILLDASEHNYSSARMDGQNYQRVLRSKQGRLERKVLNRFVLTALDEAEARRIIRPRPGRIKTDWQWEPVPHVDPAKEAKADSILLANYQQDPFTAASRNNRDFVKICKRWKRANDLLAKLALPPLGAALSNAPTAMPESFDPPDGPNDDVNGEQNNTDQ